MPHMTELFSIRILLSMPFWKVLIQSSGSRISKLRPVMKDRREPVKNSRYPVKDS